MKAYQYSHHPDTHENWIIYHHTAKKARKFGVQIIGYEEDYLYITCVRYPDGDKYAAKNSEPKVERDDLILRQLGYHYEGDSACINCDLYPTDTDFDVCEECEQCTECGHDDECKSKGVE